MDEEMLINIVKGYRELYDTDDKMYDDHNKREIAWEEISKITKVPASECRDRWKRLRDNYRKAKKLRQIKRNQGITKVKKIKHEKILGFLDPVIKTRSDIKSLRNSAARSTSASLRDYRIDSGESDPLLPERPVEPPPKPDTVVTFFTNLGETVKSFPEEVQIRVKRDIFKIINEAEEDLCRSRRDVSNNVAKFEVEDI